MCTHELISQKETDGWLHGHNQMECQGYENLEGVFSSSGGWKRRLGCALPLECLLNTKALIDEIINVGIPPGMVDSS